MSNVPNYQTPPPPDDTLKTLIPYKNAPALISYYLGIFSLFPCLGLFLAIPAVILGIKGIKLANAHPEAKGKVHAYVGLICGLIFGFIWLIADIVFPIVIMAAPHR